MTRSSREILAALSRGELTVDEALESIRDSYFEVAGGHSVVDHDRLERNGATEVIFGLQKSAQQIVDIASALRARARAVLVTRVDPNVAATVVASLDAATYHHDARAITIGAPTPPRASHLVGVVSAGTSDATVAAEARITAEFHGCTVESFVDCGVAGLHRLLAHMPRLRTARVLIVVAGMEGALPSVVGGLVPCPVIAVPTSVGYGASFGGLSALLGMLNSCVGGVAVVNIDNGFGAGVLASRICTSAGAMTGTT